MLAHTLLLPRMSNLIIGRSFTFALECVLDAASVVEFGALLGGGAEVGWWARGCWGVCILFVEFFYKLLLHVEARVMQRLARKSFQINFLGVSFVKLQSSTSFLHILRYATLPSLTSRENWVDSDWYGAPVSIKPLFGRSLLRWLQRRDAHLAARLGWWKDLYCFEIHDLHFIIALSCSCNRLVPGNISWDAFLGAADSYGAFLSLSIMLGDRPAAWVGHVRQLYFLRHPEVAALAEELVDDVGCWQAFK